MAMKVKMRAMFHVVDVCPMFGLMNEDRHTVAEDRKNRTNRNCDRAHGPYVHPHGNSKRRGACRRDRSAEAGNHAHCEQEDRRSDRKAFDPCRQPFQVRVELEHV